MSITRINHSLPSILLLAILSGSPLWASEVDEPQASTDTEVESLSGPFPMPAPRMRELNPDLIYAVLMGEVAAHRDLVPEAYRHYQQAAAISGDASLAERAAVISLFLKDDKVAENSMAYWVERAPNSIRARRYAAALALKAKQWEQAYQQLSALLQLAVGKKVDGYVLVAAVLAKVEEHQPALDLMARMVGKENNDANAWFAQAMLAAEFKQYPLALEGVNQSERLKPKQEQSILLKARVLLAMERSEEGLQALAKAVAADEKNAALRLHYARFLVQAKAYEKAYQQFHQLLKRGESDPSIRYALGVLAMELKRNAEAEGHFNALRDDAQHQNEAIYYLGRLAEEKKQPEAAMAWYRQVAGGEYLFQAQIRIAELMAKSGQIAQARQLFDEARKRWPAHAPRFFMAEGALLKEHGVPSDDVWRLFDLAVAAFPGNLDLLYARALYGADQGRIDILERDLRELLRVKPEHVDALNALGYSLADQTNRHQEALEYIKKAFALKSDNPAILDSMGWVHYRLGRYEDALGYLRQAIDKLFDAEIAAHLGEVLWVSGKQADARQIWHKALEKFSDNRVLLKTLERFGVKQQ